LGGVFVGIIGRGVCEADGLGDLARRDGAGGAEQDGLDLRREPFGHVDRRGGLGGLFAALAAAFAGRAAGVPRAVGGGDGLDLAEVGGGFRRGVIGGRGRRGVVRNRRGFHAGMVSGKPPFGL